MNSFSYSIGELKQELAKDYQEEYLKLFEFGTKNQRVEIISNKILFVASHKRVASLKSLDDKRRDATRVMDVMLIDEFKEQFKKKLENKYGFHIVSILKDYDPVAELAATVIILDQDVMNLF